MHVVYPNHFSDLTLNYPKYPLYHNWKCLKMIKKNNISCSTSDEEITFIEKVEYIIIWA